MKGLLLPNFGETKGICDLAIRGFGGEITFLIFNSIYYGFEMIEVPDFETSVFE